jgi:hypothetical protein
MVNKINFDLDLHITFGKKAPTEIREKVAGKALKIENENLME